MGYRHSLYILEKSKVNKLTSEEIEQLECRYDCLENLGGKEIFELGKYSDEGFELCQKALKVEGNLAEFRNAMFYEGDTQFEFISPEQLIWLAQKYKERTVKYWQKLVSDEPLETYSKVITDVGEKCKYYVEDLLHWKDFMLDTNKENKFSLQTTWKYEYEMFNIIHCYKSIDWDKYYLVIIGG